MGYGWRFVEAWVSGRYALHHVKEWADKYKGSTAETTDVASTIGHRFTCTIAKVTLEVRAVFSLQRQLPPFMLRHQFKPRDSEFLADMTRQKGSDIHTDQLEPGDFEGVIDFAGTTDTQIFRGRFSRVVCNHGSVPGGMAAFTFPVTPESAIFCGEKVAAGTLCVIAPGDYYSYLAAADHPFFGGCIVAERLESCSTPPSSHHPRKGTTANGDRADSTCRDGAGACGHQRRLCSSAKLRHGARPRGS